MAVPYRLGNPSYQMITGKCDTYGLLTKHEVKMRGYWPSSFFFLLSKHAKKKGNIQPSEPNKLV